MGLKDLLRRWSRGEDARAVDRAKEESGMTPVERDEDREDFEARKDDIAATRGYAGSEAEQAAEAELDDH